MGKSLNKIAEEVLEPIVIADISPDEDNFDEEYLLLKRHLPKGVDIQDALEFGFYEYKHRYWVRRKEGTFEPVSNFTMKVLYLIVGANPKRIVEIRNVHGRSATLDFGIEDLISLEKFKGRVEASGNFLFEGRPADLARIKNKLYTLEKPSIEISRLGQYKNHFWTWANGIYAGAEFYPIDEKGMVQVGEEHYYIPVFGETRADDDDDLRNYRRFLHRDGSSVTFREWSTLFCQVYGDNGAMGIAFGLYAIFSDLIFNQTKSAPMLFLFGQRGSGKGTLANSLMCLFGYPQDPLMLGGASTVVGFMRKLGQFCNAIVWLDEYKNDIGERKIESLKNIWDRVGYERGVKDSSNRTQTTPVTSSAIISGQEIPNVEPALFSRCVLLEFRAMHRSQAEVNRFNDLRQMEDGGITTATLEILRLRHLIRDHFKTHYNAVAKALRNAYSDADVIERQIINYSILVGTVMCVEDHLPLPFTGIQLCQLSEQYIQRQRDMMKQSNEVQQFIEMLAFLLSQGLIKDGKDIHLNAGLIKVRMIAVIALYRDYSRRQGLKPLDKGTLLNYIENSDAFDKEETKKSSHRFPDLTNPTSCTVFLHDKVKVLYGVDFWSISQNAENQPQAPDDGPF